MNLKFDAIKKQLEKDGAGDDGSLEADCSISVFQMGLFCVCIYIYYLPATLVSI